LTIKVPSPGGVSSACGSEFGGCYAAATQTMVLPGESEFSSMPLEMMVAHEYGHHLARNRKNESWDASLLGPKHWATYEGVCQGVASGTMYPGGGGNRYWDQPGEAFAQAYAFMHHPNVVPWWWSFGKPDAGAFAAIRADIDNQPTSAQKKWTSRLSSGKRRASMTLDTPYDGRLTTRVRKTGSVRYKLAVRSPEGTVLRKVKSSQKKFDVTVCGTRSLRLKVRRTSGRGRVKVKLHTP
jgi:hypothetical protein